MIPQPARRSTSIRWSRDTNTPAGEFVTFTAEELKALDVESSKIVDLEKFVPPDNIDPVYFDSSYYLHPDGPIAVETLRVIGAAMAEARVVGLGRLTLSRRERMVMVEPSGIGMALFALRAASDVRAPEFGNVEGDLDAEMVAIAGAIISQRTGPESAAIVTRLKLCAVVLSLHAHLSRPFLDRSALSLSRCPKIRSR